MTMLLCGTSILHDIIAKKSRLSLDLVNLRQRLRDLQSYSASIGDKEISVEDLMNAPSSMFQRMSIFMMASHQAGVNGANQNINGVLAMNQANMTQIPAELQQQYQASVWRSLYNQAREKMSQQETALLNNEERKLDDEKTQKETELQLLESEEKTTKEAVDAAAKEAAPHYV